MEFILQIRLQSIKVSNIKQTNHIDYYTNATLKLDINNEQASMFSEKKNKITFLKFKDKLLRYLYAAYSR